MDKAHNEGKLLLAELPSIGIQKGVTNIADQKTCSEIIMKEAEWKVMERTSHSKKSK